MSETKAQIIEQLKALGVEFDPDQTKAVLQGLLEETLAKQAVTATHTVTETDSVVDPQSLEGKQVTVTNLDGSETARNADGLIEGTPIQEEPDAQTLTQQDSDGQTEAQSDATPEDPEQEQDPGQDSTGQPSADPVSAPETVVPPAVELESDTPQAPESHPEFVRVRLAADSPVGRLVIPGFSGFDRRQTAMISRVAFDEHKGEYLIEEVTD